MDVIYWLIPLSIAILLVAIAIFFWAVKSGQFQDLDSPAIEILFDKDSPQSDSKAESQQKNETTH